MARSPKRARFLVKDAAQVRALSGPLPHRLVSALERLGACTVSDLAAAIDEPPASLYYHVRKFVRTGLVRECGTRGEGTRAETVYEIPGRELVFDHANESSEYLAALGKAVASVLRLASRTYETALGRRGARRLGSRRNQMIQQHYARLSATDLAELNRRLEDIADFVRERDRPGAKPWVSITMVLAPLLRRTDRD